MTGNKIKGAKVELWRRLVLLISLLTGIYLMTYVVGALVTVTWVDFAAQQEQLLDSPYGVVSSERQRQHDLSLEEYIKEKTLGRVVEVDARKWSDLFNQVYFASSGQFEKSIYRDRVSEDDKKWYTSGRRFIPVFLRLDEIPFKEWGLGEAKDGDFIYLATSSQGKTFYLRIEYKNYNEKVGPMQCIISKPPAQLFHPYRQWGAGIITAGLIFAIFLPRRKKEEDVIEYPQGRLIAGDLVGLILLGLFYSLPFLINGGAVQAITGWWGLSLIFWVLALGPVIIFLVSAWYASFRVILRDNNLYRVTFKGVEQLGFAEIEQVEQVLMGNPKWFRKLFFITVLLSLLGGGGSATSAGTYLLAESAEYAGLAIKRRDGKIMYIWYTDQLGNILLPGYDRIIEGLTAAGVPYSQNPRKIEGFFLFK